MASNFQAFFARASVPTTPSLPLVHTTPATYWCR